MTKYEYRVEVHNAADAELVAWLNEQSAEGWRLVQVDGHTYYFEREVQEIETKG